MDGSDRTPPHGFALSQRSAGINLLQVVWRSLKMIDEKLHISEYKEGSHLYVQTPLMNINNTGLERICV